MAVCCMHTVDMKRNCIPDDFIFFQMQRIERVIHHLLDNDCSPNY